MVSEGGRGSLLDACYQSKAVLPLCCEEKPQIYLGKKNQKIIKNPDIQNV